MTDNGSNGSNLSVYGTVTAGLVQLLNRESVSRDFVRFRMELAAIQQSQTDVASASFGNGAARPEDAVDHAAINANFARISAAAEQYGGHSEAMIRLLESVNHDQHLLGNAVQSLLSGASHRQLSATGDQLGIPPDFLTYIVGMLASPIQVAWNHCHQDVTSRAQAADDDSPVCPACGGEAALAVLQREDGKRKLYCGVCGTGWSYRRIGCPFCGCTDQGKLGVLFTEDSQSDGIETCEACRCYIKSIDERRIPQDEELPLFVYETASLHLDLIAEQEGYTRRALYVALA